MANGKQKKNSSFEWWYIAHFVFGVVYLGFVPILVPTYVIEISGSAAEAGVVMAIIGLGALLAPAIGGFADKYQAHRIAQLAGLLSLALGGVAFAIAQEDLFFAIAAILVGVGVATVMMINPTFIVGAGFVQELESRRLTRLNQTAIVGQLTGGLLVAGLTQAGLSFPALAGRLSVATMGTTQGFLMGSLAIGAALGSLAGGLAAESIGFHSLPWITAGGVVLALLFGYMAISRTRTSKPAEVTA